MGEMGLFEVLGLFEVREKPCRKCGHAKTWTVEGEPGRVIPLNPGAQVQYLRPSPVRRSVSTLSIVPRWVR